MGKSIVADKSYCFSIGIIELYKNLTDDKREFILSKQMLRSGTSIGANIQEALGSPTTKDFTYKMSLAYKESLETTYWIRLLRDTSYIDENIANKHIDLCIELTKMLISIQKSCKRL